MQAVRKKWVMLKTYRRVRKLWNEYKEVAQIEDVAIVGSKLNEFLDSFVVSYQDLMTDPNVKINLDKIYGDCSQILLNLVDMVEREAERSDSQENIVADLLNKALNVAELILHDEKYQLVVKETPNLINRILALLDSLKTVENKKLVLRVITVLAANNENKLEIGRLEGFAKILKLLLDQDNELTREILKTLKHFLDVQNNAVMDGVKDLAEDTKRASTTITELLPGTIRTVVSDVTRVLVSVFSKESTTATDDYESDKDEATTIGFESTSFIPSKEDITEALEKLSKSSKPASQGPLVESLPSSTTISPTMRAIRPNEEEILKEFMRVQGALTTLTTTLQEAALTVQLDLVETISKLIFQSQENQHEFKKINGYSFFSRLFDSIGDSSTSKESRLFLEDCFSLLFMITLDGNKSKRVGNHDALEFLFHITDFSKQHEVKLQALRCIQDLLSVNPLNVVDVKFVGGPETVLKLLIDMQDTKLDHRRDQLARAVLDLLNYIGVLLSNHNIEVILSYLALLSTPIDRRVKLHVHSCMGAVLADFLYHRINIPDTFLASYLNWFKIWLDKQVQHQKASNEPEETLLEQEQMLQGLEIIGLTIKDNAHKYSFFVELGGFDFLSHLLTLPALGNEVMELSLWLMQDSFLVDTENLKSDDHSSNVKERVCYSIAELVQLTSTMIAPKQLFREYGGFDALFHILQNPTRFPSSTTYAALYALGTAITNCEENKVHLETVGFNTLSNIIKSSQLTLDMTLFSLVLELSCTGSLCTALSITPNKKNNYSKRVLVKISTIKSPRALYTQPIACTRNPIDTLSLSSLSLSLKERDNNQTHSNSSSRHSSFSEDGENFEFYLNGEKIEAVQEKRKEEENDGGKMEDHSSSYFMKGVDYAQLSRIQLRNGDCVMMIIDLLPIGDSRTQGEVLQLLIKLMESNPTNKKIFCLAQGLKHLLNLANESDEVVQSSYFQLIASLGSYDISPSEVRILFDLASLSLAKGATNKHKERELQMQLLFVIGSIMERRAPLHYFHFNGVDHFAQFKLVERFPKNGYSLSCWIRANYFLHEECKLLSWQDQTGRTVLDMHFKALTSTTDGTNKYCLCVQTQNLGFPPENFVFDNYNFVECGAWHHLVFAHAKQKADLYIDGEFVQSCSLNYPTNVTKERIVSLTICKNIEQQPPQSTPKKQHRHHRKSNGSFCGQIGALHFVEGVWDELTACKVYTKGTLYTLPFRLLGIDNKEFLTINPQNYEQGKEHVCVAAMMNDSMQGVSMSATSIESSPSLASTPQSYAETLKIDAFRPKKDKLELEGDILAVLHGTRALKEVIRDVGGIQLCFPFLDMGTAQQVAGLRILTAVLQQSEVNMGQFLYVHGFTILYYILSKSASELTMETFEVLFDLMCDGITFRSKKRIIRHRECLLLILDLVLVCDPSLQSLLLKSITDLLVAFPAENLPFLSLHEPNEKKESSGTNSSGLYLILNLLSGVHQVHPLLSLLRQMMHRFSMEDVEALFDFVSSDKEKHLEVKQDLLKLTYEEMQKFPHLLDFLSKAGGFQCTFYLLESPSESIRIWAIKFIGLLLHANRSNNSFFTRIFGYEVVSMLLNPFSASPAMCKSLLELALGLYQWTGEKKSTWMDIFSASEPPKSRKDGVELVHPEALHVLLELLKTSTDWELQMQWLLETERLLDPHNMDILWNTPWLDWMLDYIQTLTALEDDKNAPRILTQLFSIIQKMVLYDIARKSSQLSKLKDMVENEHFQVQVLESIIDYYEANPCLPQEQATDIITNLAQLYKYVEDIEISSRVCKRVIDSINTLVCQNTSFVRATMKNRGLFELRDNLIIRMLRGFEEEIDTRANFIYTFPFESIADQKAFRETNNGIVYLLNIFQESSTDTALQSAVYDVLKNTLGTIEENKKIICSILEDTEIIERFFGDRKDEKPAAVESPEQIGIEGNEGGPPVLSSFLEWYFSDELIAKRADIVSRIHKSLAQTEAKFKSAQKAAAHKQAKKLKLRKEKLAKGATYLNKIINEFEEKRRQKASKSLTNHNSKVNAIMIQRQQRLQSGQENWRASFNAPSTLLFSEAILPHPRELL